MSIKNYIIIGLLIVAIGFLSVKLYNANNELKAKNEQIHIQGENNSYIVKYKDNEISLLKKTNKELYDSLKQYKDEIDYLVKFKFEQKYTTDTVYIDSTKTDNNINVYEYASNENDTINYNLLIGSIKEPNWYKLDLNLKNEFMIVNKKDKDSNETTILPSTDGNISDVTIIKQNKNNFFDRFVIGPSINAGYDVINKQFGINVGFSVTYKIN